MLALLNREWHYYKRSPGDKRLTAGPRGVAALSATGLLRPDKTISKQAFR
jgi:hypothetical protein